MVLFATLIIAAGQIHELPVYEVLGEPVEKLGMERAVNYPWDQFSPEIVDLLLNAGTVEPYCIQPYWAGEAARDFGTCLDQDEVHVLLCSILDDASYRWRSGHLIIHTGRGPSAWPDPVLGLRFTGQFGTVDLRFLPGFLALQIVHPEFAQVNGVLNPSIGSSVALREFPNRPWITSGHRWWERLSSRSPD